MTTNDKTIIRLMTFSSTTLHEHASSDVEDVLAKVDRDQYAWIHVASVHDSAASTALLEHFGLPRSLATQISDPAPLISKTDTEGYIFKKFRFIAQTSAGSTAPRKRSALLIKHGETARFEEAGGAIVLGKKFLLSFDDGHAPQLLAEARTKILSSRSELQQRGVDYAAYRLLRALFVDNYLSVFRGFMDRLEGAEHILLEGGTDAAVYRDVVDLRRDLNPFERSLLYAGGFADELIREKPGALGEGVGVLAGNLVSAFATLGKEFSMVRDRTSELIQMYRDNGNTQLNNTMRTLTVLSAMFLPLNFIAAFYGMNFPNMPAVKWNGSFPIVVVVMIALVVGSLVYARRHKWL